MILTTNSATLQELLPNRDSGGLEGVQKVFQCALEQIRDRVVVEMERARIEDESLPM
jgi:hypothetical protein